MNASFAIMAALRVKEKTGRGQKIDVSMLEGQLALLSTMIGDYFMDGESCRGRWAPRTVRCCPIRPFTHETRDLALAVGSEKLWKAFCPAIGCPELDRAIRVIAAIRTGAPIARPCWRGCRKCF